MQKTFFSNLFARRQTQPSDAPQVVRAAPVELEVADLEKVAGGLTAAGPNGTWAASSMTASSTLGPNGTW